MEIREADWNFREGGLGSVTLLLSTFHVLIIRNFYVHRIRISSAEYK